MFILTRIAAAKSICKMYINHIVATSIIASLYHGCLKSAVCAYHKHFHIGPKIATESLDWYIAYYPWLQNAAGQTL